MEPMANEPTGAETLRRETIRAVNIGRMTGDTTKLHSLIHRLESDARLAKAARETEVREAVEQWRSNFGQEHYPPLDDFLAALDAEEVS